MPEAIRDALRRRDDAELALTEAGSACEQLAQAKRPRPAPEPTSPDPMIAAEEAVQAALQRRDALIESHELRFLVGERHSIVSAKLLVELLDRLDLLDRGSWRHLSILAKP